MKKATEEILTGIAIGIILSILLAIKVLAAPIGQTIDELEYWPHQAQIDEANQLLAEKRIVIPDEMAEACEYFGAKYNICPEILEAMLFVEAGCQKTAQSPDKQCKGLMQIKPSVHQARMQRLNALNVFDTWDNIEIGTDYLAELLNGTDEIAVALAKYNGQSEDKINKVRRGEYTGYVKKVLAISEALERSHFK